MTDDATFIAGTQRTFGAGVNYSFGPAVAGLVITQTSLHNATGIGAYSLRTDYSLPKR